MKSNEPTTIASVTDRHGERGVVDNQSDQFVVVSFGAGHRVRVPAVALVKRSDAEGYFLPLSLRELERYQSPLRATGERGGATAEPAEAATTAASGRR